MHKEILNKKQLELIPLTEYFCKKHFYIAGGTALALQLGHRESIDFDLFTFKSFKNDSLLKEIKMLGFTDLKVLIDQLDEYTLLINDVKVTFLRYPFKIKDIVKEDSLSLASALSIGAMKAYAIGRRGKWKDYVDLYILFKDYTFKEIVDSAEKIFDSVFSSRLFAQQLSYFKDIDYTEEVVWRISNPPLDEDIKKTLENISTSNV